jgi:hypothetical protein
MKKLQKTPDLEEKVKKLSLRVGEFKTGGLRRGVDLGVAPEKSERLFF